jgi:hypothetical protein
VEIAKTGWAPSAAKSAAALPWSRKHYGYALALILISAIAALLRFHALGARGLWLDEVLGVKVARESLPQLFQTLREREINMAFYYVLLHFWMKVGSSDAFLRSMSVIFSVATVPFTYAIGARVFGRKVGLIAAWLLALNAFHIRYAQEARAYALFTLLAAVSTYLLVRNIQEPQTALAGWYGAVLALMLYSHVLGALIIAAHGVSILFLPAREIPWKNLARSCAWLVGLALPLAVIVPLITANPLDWLPRLDAKMVLNFLILIAGNRGILLLVLEAIAVALFIFATARALIRHGRSKENWGSALILCWFFVPLAIVLAISAFRPFFVPRFLLPCLPAFLLAASAGLALIRPRSVAWTLGGAISLLCMAGIAPVYHLGGVVDDWRAISADVLSETQPGDRILFYPDYAYVPFEYYRAREAPAPEWPRDMTIDSDAEMDSSIPVGSLSGGSQNADTATRRLWVVYYAPAGLTMATRANLRANLLTWQSKGWPLRQEREFADVLVLLFVASSADAVPSNQLPDLSAPSGTSPQPSGSAAP